MRLSKNTASKDSTETFREGESAGWQLVGQGCLSECANALFLHHRVSHLQLSHSRRHSCNIMPTMKCKSRRWCEMVEIVTLELPEKLAQQAKEIASLTHRRLEDVLVEFIDRAITELPVESLPDQQVLALCDLQMETEQQEVFSDLLARNREGQLNDSEVRQLDELMQVYRNSFLAY